MKKPEEFLTELRSRLQHKCNLDLLEHLATLKGGSKRVAGQAYLTFTGSAETDMLFLPEGSSRAPRPAHPCVPEMLEFYSAFDGLRERKPPLSGHFLPCSSLPKLGQELDPEDFPTFKKYAECPVVFVATNGDQLIQLPGNKFAWAVPSEDKVRSAAANFSSLLLKYVAHRKAGKGRPFDSYGLPD